MTKRFELEIKGIELYEFEVKLDSAEYFCHAEFDESCGRDDAQFWSLKAWGEDDVEVTDPVILKQLESRCWDLWLEYEPHDPRGEPEHWGER